MAEVTIFPSEEIPASDKTEMLKNINTAINTVMIGGQSYKIGSRSLTRADLYTLLRAREALMAEINADNNNDGLFDDCYVGIFDRR